jgi:hypothetical protein
MTPNLNCQHFLAKQFHDDDLSVVKASIEAFQVINKWRYINGLSYLNKEMKREANCMLQKTLFTYIDNHEVLNSEGFFQESLHN